LENLKNDVNGNLQSIRSDLKSNADRFHAEIDDVKRQLKSEVSRLSFSSSDFRPMSLSSDIALATGDHAHHQSQPPSSSLSLTVEDDKSVSRSAGLPPRAGEGAQRLAVHRSSSSSERRAVDRAADSSGKSVSSVSSHSSRTKDTPSSGVGDRVSVSERLAMLRNKVGKDHPTSESAARRNSAS
jgi:hypothetical protein